MGLTITGRNILRDIPIFFSFFFYWVDLLLMIESDSWVHGYYKDVIFFFDNEWKLFDLNVFLPRFNLIFQL